MLTKRKEKLLFVPRVSRFILDRGHLTHSAICRTQWNVVGITRFDRYGAALRAVQFDGPEHRSAKYPGADEVDVPSKQTISTFLAVPEIIAGKPVKGARSRRGMLPIHLPGLLSSVHRTILPYAPAAERPLTWQSQ